MQYRNDHICRGPKGRDRCGRIFCPSLVHPLASPPQWGSTREAGDRAPHTKGGLPARTIERAWLAAMWTAGEVPGSTGKPPKICVPRLPERRYAFQTKPFNRKAIPQSGRKNLSYSPCRSSRRSIMISIIFRSELFSLSSFSQMAFRALLLSGLSSKKSMGEMPK